MEQIARIVDLGEAIALYTIGFELKRLERPKNGGNYKIFVFNPIHRNRSLVLKDILNNYTNGILEVDALTFYESTKHIKVMIHSDSEKN